MNRKWKRIFVVALFGCVGLIVSGIVVDAVTRQEMSKYLTLSDPRGNVTNPQFTFTLWGPHYFTIQLTGALEKAGHWIIKVGGVESVNEDFPASAWLLQVTYHIRVDSVLTLDILTTAVI